jgi:hypothetical protein
MKPSDWGGLAICLVILTLSVGVLLGGIKQAPGRDLKSFFAGLATVSVGMALLIIEARVWPNARLHSFAGASVWLGLALGFGPAGVADIRAIHAHLRRPRRRREPWVEVGLVALRALLFVFVSIVATVLAVACVIAAARGA